MDELRPCDECRRHVRAADDACPFCGAALAPAPPPPRFAPGRLTRAAVFAGAAVITASCGGAEPKPEGLAMQRPTPTLPITQTLRDPPQPRPDAGPAIVEENPDLEDFRRRRHRNNDSNLPMPYGAPPARDRRV